MNETLRNLQIESQKLANRVSYDTPSDTSYYEFLKEVVDEFISMFTNCTGDTCNHLVVRVRTVADKLHMSTETTNDVIRKLENSGLLNETDIQYVPFVSQFKLITNAPSLEM